MRPYLEHRSSLNSFLNLFPVPSAFFQCLHELFMLRSCPSASIELLCLLVLFHFFLNASDINNYKIYCFSFIFKLIDYFCNFMLKIVRKRFNLMKLQLLMGLQDYSTQKILKSNQLQLEQLLSKFKSEEVSISKLTGFLAYNFFALSGLLGFTSWYVKSHLTKKNNPNKVPKKQLSLLNVVKKGSRVGALIGGLYMVGFVIVGYYTMPIPVFKKYCQLQQSLHSFELKYDPFYQQILLFRKMKKFGLSDSLIQQIRQDLNKKKDQLILSNSLKKQTVESIRKAEQIHKKAWKSLLN